MRTTKIELICAYGIEYDAWIVQDAVKISKDGTIPVITIGSIPCELKDGCMILRSKDKDILEYRSDTSELGKSLYILKRLKQFEYDQLIRKEDNTIYLIV